MAKSGKAHTYRYDTDNAAKVILLALMRDFRGTEGISFARQAEMAFLGGIEQFREYNFPELGIISPARFKRWKQLSSLLKKYRFAQDMYYDFELDILTYNKFFGEQVRICSTPQPTPLCFRVLQRARKIAKEILGEYSPESTVATARFGKKSSIGCPLNLAYIDEKLSNVKAFTSSKRCAKWFKESLAGDPILSEMVEPILTGKVKPDLAHESLNLVLVPKNWKTKRPITPLTLVALYYSYGVGDQVTEKLCDVGIDIRRQQQRHRKLMSKMSVDCKHATADLSSASDSLTSELLNRVLPRKWYRAVSMTFSHELIVDGETHYTASVLPMGNGLTFPVETLVFYCLLRAIKELSGTWGHVSVYGDDLIYPSRLHKFVAHVFPRIGLVLNLDKTFVKAPFRESCGSDFYRGVDVRPFFLPEGGQKLSRVSYTSWLYKTYNGLRARWAEEEIPETLRWLLAELAFVTSTIFRVPPSYPTTAGILVDDPSDIPMGTSFLTWSPICCVFSRGSKWFTFTSIISTPDKRRIKTVTPYYWLALQGLDDTPEIGNFWDTDYSFYNTVPKSSLDWVTTKYVVWKRGKGNTKNRSVIENTRAFSVSRKSIGVAEKRTKSGLISFWS